MSCVRCGRPACPDCLRSAAVGQQCVECVRQGSRATRRPAGRLRRPAHLRARWSPGRWSPSTSCCYLADELVQNPVSTTAGDAGLGRLGPARSSGWPTASGTGCSPRVPAAARARRPRPARHRVQHVGADPRRPGAGAAARPGPLPDRLPGQRAGRLGAVLPRRRADAPALGASGAIFGLFGAWFVVARRLRLDSRQIVIIIVLNLGHLVRGARASPGRPTSAASSPAGADRRLRLRARGATAPLIQAAATVVLLASWSSPWSSATSSWSARRPAVRPGRAGRPAQLSLSATWWTAPRR